MEWSHYNILTQSEKLGRCFLYNTLSNILYELTHKEFELFKNIENDIKNYKLLDIKTISNLVKSKVLVNNDRLEYIKHKLIIQSSRYNKEEMLLAMNPKSTIKTGSKKYSKNINNDISCNIINFINKHNTLKKINIIWYGTNILSSHKKINEFNNNTKYLNIKNINYLLIIQGEDLIKKSLKHLDSLNINNLVIEFNNLENNILYANNFNRIVNAFSSLLSHKKYNFSVSICKKGKEGKEGKEEKEEITSKLFHIIEEICIRRNIDIQFTHESCNQYMDDNLNCKTELISLPLKKRTECIARHINGFILDSEGYIYKCWSDINSKTKAIGHITDRFDENLNLYTMYLGASDPFEDNRCRICSFLPICGGGCPRKRMEKGDASQINENCIISENNIKKCIENYYQIKFINNEK